MAGFRDYISLLMPNRRYRVKFARYKGRDDARVACPPWRECGETAERIQAQNECFEEYPDLPRPTSELGEWLKQKQRFYLGYLAELANHGHEFLYWTLSRLHRRDSVLKARSCVLKAHLPEVEEDIRIFKELFPEHRSRRSLPPAIYHLIIILAVLAELPLNIVAFRLFGENDLLTAAVALVIGIVIPVVGHWIGVTLKRPSRSRVDWAMIAISSAIVLSTIIGVGRIRAIYLKSVGTTSDPAVEFFFYAFQFLFFAASIFLAYSSSDLYLELQEHYNRLKAAITEVEGRRKNLRTRLRKPVENVWSAIGELKSSYTMENANAGGPLRRVSNVPTIVLDIPSDFDVIDQDCPKPIEEVAAEDEPAWASVDHSDNLQESEV